MRFLHWLQLFTSISWLIKLIWLVQDIEYGVDVALELIVVFVRVAMPRRYPRLVDLIVQSALQSKLETAQSIREN